MELLPQFPGESLKGFIDGYEIKDLSGTLIELRLRLWPHFAMQAFGLKRLECGAIDL